MRKIKSKLWIKILASILLALSTSAFATGAIATFIMVDQGYYNTNDYFETRIFNNLANRSLYRTEQILEEMHDESNPDNSTSSAIEASLYDSDGNPSNFLFIVTDKDDRIVLSNTEQLTQRYLSETTYSASDRSVYHIRYSIADPMMRNDAIKQNYEYFNLFSPYKWLILSLTIVFFVISALLYGFLLSAAGHRENSDVITLNFQDKIPLELYAALLFFGCFVCFSQLETAYYFYSIWDGLLYGYPFLLALGFLLLAASMSLATRLKTNTLIKNTFIYRSLAFLYSFVCNLKITWQVVLLFGSYFLAILIFNHSVELITLLFLASLFCIIALSAVQMNALLIAGKTIAEGNLDHQVETKNLIWKYKEHANNLNHIQFGMSRAVENAMKSERFKTELITNVSHDIKTPLTSIINYIDLLRKQELNNETANEYLKILDKHAHRLKKMTQDLVEVSKASTGNINVEIEKLNVVELLNQSIGEFEEVFQAARLTPILSTSEDEICIMADGKLMWRVFDNLFANVSKYAQPETRVYIDVERNSSTVRIAVKNVSVDPLNITSEELMERFVRGDVSRSTEGSGLGLFITRSLLELQKATFNIAIDGDLFKTEIGFTAAD